MALGNALNEFAFGTPATTQQIQRFTPEQQQLMNQVGQQSFKGLQGTNLDYAPIAERLKKEYTSQTLPNLLARFQAGMGSSDPFSGSPLGSILQGGEADLAERLAAGESGYNLNKYNTLLGGLNVGLQPQFESARFAAQPGLAQQVGGALGQGLTYAGLLSALGGKETQASTGFNQQPQQQQQSWPSWLKGLLGSLVSGGGSVAGSLAGGPIGGVVGGALGNAASQFLTPSQMSYQAATGQQVMQSPFAQKPAYAPTLQELMHQSRTGQVPMQAPFKQPFGG